MAAQMVQANAITCEFITVFSSLSVKLGEVAGAGGLRTRGWA
jgi:hypothetical protein